MSVRFQNKATSHFGTAARVTLIENCWLEAIVHPEGHEIFQMEDFP